MSKHAKTPAFARLLRCVSCRAMDYEAEVADMAESSADCKLRALCKCPNIGRDLFIIQNFKCVPLERVNSRL